MSKWIQKSTRTSRRGLACALAVALALSSLSAAPPAGAAEKKKPTLNVKKKTLYWNKPDSKNYTLKIKKNKVKMIVATTWKTSKKSVVALSRKKDTSVKLTAKKKGTAVITAIVKYVPRDKWAIKTVKLTCKVVSKGTSPAKTPPAKTEPAQTPLIIYTTMPTLPPQPWTTEKPTDTPEPGETADPDRTPGPDETADPDGTPNPGETADPDKSQEPTSTPNTPGDSTVREVVLSTSEVLLGMEKGRNTITLTASARDGDGNPLENQTVTWTSDNENAATVDGGIVTAAGNGTAHITATAGNVTSKPCTVTVDAVKPVIKEADLSDGRTFYVAFSEPVAGTPSVSVKAKDNTTVECDSLKLSEDGKSMTVACRNILSAGSYELTINGLEDLAGNKMAEDSRTSVEKDPSVPVAFICKTDQAPAGQSSFDVYFSVMDQYGEEYDTLAVMSEGVLTASAQTENGMPFKTQVNQQDGYIRVSGSASAFTEGRKIKITLTYSVSGAAVIEENMTVTLVDAANKGKAVKIAGLNAESKTMDKGGTADADKPVFQLSGTEEDNVFTLSSKLLDVFGYEADPSDVIYMIEDESILAFSGTDGAASGGIHTSSQPVDVRALKGGRTTITAYLASDDSQRYKITVTIKSTSLREIAVAAPGEGTNGKMTEAKITLIPAGTGLTADDLKYRVTAGKERLEELVFVQEKDGIYINITAATDGGDAPIRFVVYSDGVESEEITYISTPSLTAAKIEIDDFKVNGVTAGASAATTYRIRNRYGEDITNRTAKQPTCGISVPDVVKSAATGTGEDAGTLTIDALNVGTSEITLSMPGDSSVNAKVNVTVVGKAYVKEIRFGKATMDGLKLGDTGILYIPVQAYDQYGNEYEAFTKQTLSDEDLEITVNSKNVASCDYDLVVDYYEATTSQTAINDNTTKIGAIGIYWKNQGGNAPKAGEILKISFTGSRDDLKMTPYGLLVDAASEISRLEFGSDVQAAIPGTKVENTVKLFDQYKAEVTTLVSGQTLQLEVVEKDKTPATDITTTSPITNIATPISLGISGMLTERKEYTVQVWLKDTTDSNIKDFESAHVKGTYTLLVDTADNLLEKIEISNKAAKGNSSAYSFLLDSQYVNLDNSGKGTQLTFDCKMYTLYQGRAVEVAWKDGSTAQIGANNLIWNVTVPETVDATAGATKDIYTFKTAEGITDPIDDVVTVSLTYLSDVKTLSADDRSIKVSNKPAKPQGEYRLVIVNDDSSYGSIDYLDKNNTAVVATGTGTKFALITDDQYGEEYGDTRLFTVISSKGIFGVDSTIKFPTSDGTFTLVSKKTGSAVDTIKVYVTKDDFYEFTAQEPSS